jgi:hypothetical protein
MATPQMNEIEDLATKYSKPQLQRMAAMGQINPTMAVMAGMLIDRIVQDNIKAPTTTVAEDTGIAALPQAQQAPQMQQPQMGMPTPTPAPQPQQPAMPTMTAADGGLMALPIPDSMYDDSYAGGGVVAFSNGGWNQSSTGLYTLGEEQSGGLMDIEDLIAAAQARRNIPLNEYEIAALERAKSAPTRAKQTREDARNEFLTRLGFGMMGTKSPYLLQAAGESGAAATPALTAGAKEAKEIEEAGIKELAASGRQQRTEQLAGITAGEQMYGREQDRVSRETQARLDRENRLAVASIPDKTIQVAAELRSKNPSLSYLDSVSQAAQALSPKDTYNATRTAVSAAAKDANAEFTSRLAFDPKLQEDMRKAAAGDQAATARVKAIRDKIQESVFKLYQVEGVDLSGGKMGAPTAGVIDFSALPPGTR